MIMMDAWLKGSTFRESAVAEPYNEDDSHDDEDSDEDETKKKKKRKKRRRNKENRKQNQKKTEGANMDTETRVLDHDMRLSALYSDEQGTSIHNPMTANEQVDAVDSSKEDEAYSSDDYDYEENYMDDDKFVARSELESLLQDRDEQNSKMMEQNQKMMERNQEMMKDIESRIALLSGTKSDMSSMKDDEDDFVDDVIPLRPSVQHQARASMRANRRVSTMAELANNDESRTKTSTSTTRKVPTIEEGRESRNSEGRQSRSSKLERGASIYNVQHEEDDM